MKKLNKQTQQAIAYSQNALSFVFLDPTITNKCNTVYLFGSASRGEMEKESDVDLFFDYEAFFPDPSKNEKMVKEKEAAIKAALSRFSNSNDYQKWKLLGFIHPFSVQVGKLEEWDLKTSVHADGISLYSKNPSLSLTKKYILITYVLPKKKKEYLSFIRTVFGRNEQGYADTGFVGKYNAKKIASTAVLVPQEHAQLFFKFFQQEKIEYSFMELGLLS